MGNCPTLRRQTTSLTSVFLSRGVAFGLSLLASTTSPAFDTGDFREPFDMFYDMAHLYDYDGRRPGSGL